MTGEITRSWRAAAALLLVGLLAVGCGGVDDGSELPPAVRGEGESWPTLPDDGTARAVTTPSGQTLPVLADNGDGTHVVETPCSNQATVSGTPLAGAHVVLDPGHGGEESGAVGPNGLREADVNLAVAQRAAETLQAAGATVVLTRTSDVRITLAARANLAQALQPAAFLSLHHNTEPDGPSDRPGSEVYFQIADPESQRLAGLLHEELLAAFDDFAVPWVSDTGAGALARVRSDDPNVDYYGVLRQSAGVPAVLAEAAYLSNPAEADLLATPGFQQVEADAIARAIVRFVSTDDPGSGFAANRVGGSSGPGGGTAGCEDPPLG